MSRKFISVSVLICLLLGIVGLAMAKQKKIGFQEKGNGKQIVAMFKDKLGLSSDQVAKLKDLMAKHRKGSKLMHSKFEVVLAELKVLVQSDDTKPAEYTEKLNQLANLKTQFDISNESYLKAVKAILTPEQQARFELLQRKMFGFGEKKEFDKKRLAKNPGNKDLKKEFAKSKFNKDFGKKTFGMEGKLPAQLKKKLGLTDTQVNQLKDEAKKAIDETKGIQAKLEADFKDLRVMLQDKNTKPEQFTAKLNDITNLKIQLKQIMEKHRKIIAAIFTPEQQAKIELFKMERMQKMSQGFGNMGYDHKNGKKDWHK